MNQPRSGLFPNCPTHNPSQAMGVSPDLLGGESPISSVRKALVQQENRQAEQHDGPETGPRHPDTAAGGAGYHIVV